MSVAIRPHRPIPAAAPLRPRRRLALAVLCVSLLIVTLDNTILNIALSALVRAMRASDAQLRWIVDAYAVVFGGLLLVAGTVADRLGRRRVFLAGLLLFAAGAAAAGLAVLVLFALWERRAHHPMLVVEALRDRRFSVAMGSVAMAVFALMGALFLLAQYLQFSLGYSAFAAGVRILPVAGLLAVTAPLSTLLDW